MDERHSFSRTPKVEIPRSSFNRSHVGKTTMDASYLVPIYRDFAYPGDTHDMKMSLFARLSTPIFPLMDNIDCEVWFFAVPIRQIWTNFKKFMGEQHDPADSIAYTLPVMDVASNVTAGSLHDYMGLPLGIGAGGTNIVSLWHRSYHKIWSEWFRSQDIDDSIDWDVDDGPDTESDYDDLLKVRKRHDYFTSCLPYPQKSGTTTSLPIGSSADIYGDNMDFDQANDSGNYAQVLDAKGGNLRSLITNQTLLYGDNAASGTGQLKADLTNATASTINEIREAFATQRLLERDIRSGTRYHEVIRSHFGVMDPQSMIADRSLYLGGGKVPINISQVPRTNDFASNQGADLSGIGHCAGDGIGFKASFTEHCVLLGLMAFRGDVTYQQGIPREFWDSTRYDLFWPAFAHLGEQAVLDGEIWADGTAADDGVFGYVGAWDHLRYKPSWVSGAFRSDAGTNYDEWHLSEDFAALPSLDSTFLADNTVTVLDRAIATPAEPQFIVDMYFNLTSVRPMPSYSVPGYVDHF